jgi:Cu-Zn family superoxide dismutase
MKNQTAYTSAAMAAVAFLAGSATVPPAAAAPPSLPGISVVQGTFSAWAEGNTATTYNPELVPEGAQAKAIVIAGQGGTQTVLTVAGLLPAREYGAHAHVNPCGATGAAAGPHYQDRVDPVTPSVDPAYANPDNEIWLDFTTSSAGTAAAVSSVDWTARPGVRSITIHAMHTHTAPGQAGTAGARLACLTVDFAPGQ